MKAKKPALASPKPVSNQQAVSPSGAGPSGIQTIQESLVYEKEFPIAEEIEEELKVIDRQSEVNQELRQKRNLPTINDSRFLIH